MEENFKVIEEFHSGQDGIIGTGFASPPKTTKTLDKI